MPDGTGGAPGAGYSGIEALRAIANGQGAINPYSAQQQQQAATKYVWMGDSFPDEQGKIHTRVPDDGPGTYKIKGGFSPKEYEATLGLPFWWDEKQKQGAYERASAATGVSITSFSQFQKVWELAVDTAEQSWAATNGQKPITPWQAMELMKESIAQAYGSASDRGPVTTTSRTTTVNKLSDGSAWQILKSAAQNALGRNPTHEELRSFAARANRIAVENPDVSTTTTTTDSSGNSNSKSTRQQGATTDDYLTEAEDKVDNEEAGAYQAATTYYSAMLSGLNSVV